MKPDHWKIYEFICRHFIATVLPKAQIQEVSATFSIGKEAFSYKGKRIKSPGFLQAMPWLTKRYSEIIQFSEKEVLKLASLTIEKAKVRMRGVKRIDPAATSFVGK